MTSASSEFVNVVGVPGVQSPPEEDDSEGVDSSRRRLLLVASGSPDAGAPGGSTLQWLHHSGAMGPLAEDLPWTRRELRPVGDEDGVVYVLGGMPGWEAPGGVSASLAGPTLTFRLADRHIVDATAQDHDPSRGPREILLESIASGLFGDSDPLVANRRTIRRQLGEGLTGATPAWEGGTSTVSTAGRLLPGPANGDSDGPGSGVLATLVGIDASLDAAAALLAAPQRTERSHHNQDDNDHGIEHSSPLDTETTVYTQHRRSALALRRALQSSDCNTTAATAPNATSLAAAGLASSGPVSSSCASPPVDSLAVAMGVLLGAAADLDRLTQQMQEQQVRRHSTQRVSLPCRILVPRL